MSKRSEQKRPRGPHGVFAILLFLLLFVEIPRFVPSFQSLLEGVYSFLYPQAIFLFVSLSLLALFRLPFGKTFFVRIPGWRGIASIVLSFIGITGIIMLMQPLLYEIPVLQPNPERLDMLEKSLSDILDRGPFFTILILAIVPALCEELFFRGFLLRSFANSIPPLAAAAVCGVIFAIGHALLLQRILMTFMGFFLALLVWKSRSIIIAIVLHLSHNLSVLYLEYISSSSRPEADNPEEYLPAQSFVDQFSTVGIVLMLLAGGLLIAAALYLAERDYRASSQSPAHLPYKGP